MVAVGIHLTLLKLKVIVGTTDLSWSHSYLHVLVHVDARISCHPQLRLQTWNRDK